MLKSSARMALSASDDKILRCNAHAGIAPASIQDTIDSCGGRAPGVQRANDQRVPLKIDTKRGARIARAISEPRRRPRCSDNRLTMEKAMPTPSGHTSAILASKVQGKSVYNTKGEKIGHVEDIVLDKMSNSIEFAVLGFGGVLGMGEKFHPVPWALLDYSPDMGGYVVP